MASTASLTSSNSSNDGAGGGEPESCSTGDNVCAAKSSQRAFVSVRGGASGVVQANVALPAASTSTWKSRVVSPVAVTWWTAPRSPFAARVRALPTRFASFESQISVARPSSVTATSCPIPAA